MTVRPRRRPTGSFFRALGLLGKGPSVIALAVFVGVIFSAQASAPAATPVRFEAEGMSHGSFASVVKERKYGASGGRVLRYEGGGRAARSVNLSSTSTAIVVRARNADTSTSAIGLRVFVDGTVVGTKTITRNAKTFIAYRFPTELGPGPHTIGVAGLDLGGKNSLVTDVVSIEGPEPSCVGKQVGPGDDLDAVVNADPASTGSTFCVQAGTYQVDNTIRVKTGDRIFGAPGTIKQRGPAIDPDPVVKIINAGGLPRVIDASGSGIHLRWLEVQGSPSGARYTDDTPETCSNWSEVSGRCPATGTGVAIGAGTSGADAVFERLEVHNNPSNCITGVSGKLLESDLYNCSQNADYWGFTAGALKTIYEAEVARNFVHDNEAVGLWCDQGCRNTPERTRGFWVHDNLVVDNGRAGVRYEFSPMPGEPSRSSALVANNRLAGNKWGGADMHDAQNATFNRNIFGSQTVAGVAYERNGADSYGLQFSDSGRLERTNLRNGDAIGNYMNGENISGCDKPDTIVDCRGNR